ncbi:AP2-like ethylene-responsive transcription factor PLT1 [Hondaea fermentalgiana]|uniref:AP2-like ethylene-responsive transcription factor PLT1 n=1 Tax=Hondaea fermentalgiana TaxID=2315210 RepID=A0A2R5GG32_9STRA|nr:AP2-like ethylene-responsive transcription factor PLT1 [Hondaea fermentalgiana]|eukprot:GBG28728.1 AP2-like ethylene-responsive transcription factor PLT1 [Hondaea fermentalgiana]
MGYYSWPVLGWNTVPQVFSGDAQNVNQAPSYLGQHSNGTEAPQINLQNHHQQQQQNIQQQQPQQQQQQQQQLYMPQQQQSTQTPQHEMSSPRSPHVHPSNKSDEGEALEALGSLLRRPNNNNNNNVTATNNNGSSNNNNFDDAKSSSNRLLNALKSLDSPTWNQQHYQQQPQSTFTLQPSFDSNIKQQQQQQTIPAVPSLTSSTNFNGNVDSQQQDYSKKRRASQQSLAALHQSILMDTNVEDLKMVKPTSSKYRGVSWHSRAKTWTARVWNAAENKSIHLGVFNTELRAALAFDLKARELFGRKFKGFNFPCSKERVALIRTLAQEDALPSSDEVKEVLNDPEVSIQKLAKSTDNRATKKRRQS